MSMGEVVSPVAEGGSSSSTLRRPKLGALLRSDPNIATISEEAYTYSNRNSNASFRSSSNFYNRSPMIGGDASPSPYLLSPWIQSSPYTNSPWIQLMEDRRNSPHRNGLLGSLVREEGHVYSLAVSFDLLYTGSDSRNIRVWRNLKEFSGFKSSSGLVKAIVVSGDRVFTGHQDGKIRVWKCSPMNYRKPYRRLGSLPTTKDFIKSSLNPKNYVEVRRHRNVPWIRHFDAVSCLSLDMDQGLIYSGSWDKTVKVWRIRDSKCLESIYAHDDAVNSVAAGFDGLLFTGSADGTAKVWRRELIGRTTKHVLVQTLLKQENAVTSVAVNVTAATVYCGSSDGLVNFWVREKYELLHGGVLRGHKLAVLCLATAGNLVFSGSADNSICVWRLDEGGDHRCVNVLTGHCGPVKCLAVEEDHESWPAPKGGDQRFVVYSGSLDKSVKVWTVSDTAIQTQ